MLIDEGEDWKYFKGTKAPSSAALEWTRLDFDDENWPSGPAGFGYGDGDDAPVLDDMGNGYTTLYIRREFEVVDPGSYPDLFLSVTVDDGFIAYLNGQVVARARAGADTLPHDAVATYNA